MYARSVDFSALVFSLSSHRYSLGDHLQTCRVKSVVSHDQYWVTDKERGDLEIKDYVVLQKPQEQANRLPPPRTLILDFTLRWIGKRVY